MNDKRWVRKCFTCLIVASALVLLLLPGNGGLAKSSAEVNSTSKNLIVGISYEPTGLDPALETQSVSLLVINQIYDTLVRYSPGGTGIEPGLASSWSLSPDRLTWTFNLRPGVQFHDGTPLDSSAVLYNFERWWNDKTGSMYYFTFVFGAPKGEPGSLIKSLSVNGPNQFIIELNLPSNTLLDALTIPSFGIASPTAIQAGTLAAAPVGSGPFRFDQWTAGVQILLNANTSYWGGAPALDTLTFKIIPDNNLRLMDVQLDSIQVALDLPNDFAAIALLDSNLKVLYRPPASIGYLGINRNYSPLDNHLVRKAIAHAINKPKLIDDCFGPGTLLADQFLPPSVWGYDPGVAVYDYNPELAMALLDQAGFPNGFSTTLAYRNVYRPYMTSPKGVAEAIAADLNAVEIQTTVIEYGSVEFLNKYYSGEHKLFLLGWMADYMHPDDFFSPHFCTENILSFGPNDEYLCALIDSARMDPDREDQLILYRLASNRVMDNLLVIPLNYNRPLIVTRSNVAGYIPSPMIDWFGRTFNATNWVFLPLVKR